MRNGAPSISQREREALLQTGRRSRPDDHFLQGEASFDDDISVSFATWSFIYALSHREYPAALLHYNCSWQRTLRGGVDEPSACRSRPETIIFLASLLPRTL